MSGGCVTWESELRVSHVTTLQLEQKQGCPGWYLQSLELEVGRNLSPHPSPSAPSFSGAAASCRRPASLLGWKTCLLAIAKLSCFSASVTEDGSLVPNAGSQSLQPGVHHAAHGGGGVGRPSQETAQQPCVRSLGLEVRGPGVGGAGSS